MSGGLWDLVLPASSTGQVVRQTECDHERQRVMTAELTRTKTEGMGIVSTH
jgi:hypothetical protein